MGNRAVITTREDFNNDGIGVYLHWNGGKDSVKAFLAYCKLKGYRPMEEDDYGYARLCQVVGNYFGGECSVGINKLSNIDCDNGDNGVYIVKDWEIVGREYFRGSEHETYDLYSMVLEIDKSMPEKEKLFKDKMDDEVRETLIDIINTDNC